MNRYKIKILAGALSFSVAYLACNDKALDIAPPTQSEGTYFTSEAEFRSAILGVYAALTDFYSASSATGFGSAQQQVWMLPGDDMTINGGDSYEIFKGLSEGNGKLNEFFKSAYFLNGRANKVLEKLAVAPDDLFKTPGMKKFNEGEALFLRGFSHFMLFNVFGTAPVDTIVPKSTAEFNLPSSKGTELLDQAIKDFTRAAALLPPSWNDINKGRVTANSANGMLGKALVFRGNISKNAADYQAAIAAFDRITGASLTTNFNDNFSVTTENNSESLFEFQGGKNLIGQGQNAWLGNDVCDCGVAGSYYQMFYDGAGTYMGGGRYLPTEKLSNAFEAADPRILFTLNEGKTHIVKYVVNGDALDGAVLSLNNTRVLRLADVLLLKAEAVLQSGGSTAQAIELINQVRARARGNGTLPADLNTGETNKTTIQQWIMDERLRELAGEGHRWFDLRRWHMAGFITLNNAFFSSQVADRMEFMPHHLYFPIPSAETSRNPNIVQNPGY
ncbi:MAG TPA: RagB/SusD family nutrient uptake outer membrane protein [Chitinophagaceae bacterium]|nr:RagB/SusD family nutrient uptake outer membrane protein [Chitinophagaceae bacterium]